jgi:hypothetical protein
MPPIKTMTAALVASAISLCAAPAVAGPLSQSLALNNADVGTVEQVQYRRWGRGYYAYGAVPGPGYAYGAVPGPGYAYGAAPGYVGRIWDPNYGNGGAATTWLSDRRCASDRDDDGSGWPSWACY